MGINVVIVDDQDIIRLGVRQSLGDVLAEYRRHGIRHLVALHGIKLPPAATELLASHDNEPPRPDDPRFAQNSVRIIASASLSLEAAAERLAAELRGGVRGGGFRGVRFVNPGFGLASFVDHAS